MDSVLIVSKMVLSNHCQAKTKRRSNKVVCYLCFLFYNIDYLDSGVSKSVFITLPEVLCLEFLTCGSFFNMVWKIVALFYDCSCQSRFLWSKILRTGFSIHFFQYNLFTIFELHTVTTS